MKKEEIFRKINKAALRDKKNRKDPRYIKTMALLTAKGFLMANKAFPQNANLKLDVADALWAGKTVEPRILEVLPAAVLRFPHRFYFNEEKEAVLKKVIACLRSGEQEGPDLYGSSYEKMKIWANLSLRDKRTKTFAEKRLTKTFRFHPSTAEKIHQLALKNGTTETEVIEELVRKS